MLIVHFLETVDVDIDDGDVVAIDARAL